MKFDGGKLALILDAHTPFAGAPAHRDSASLEAFFHELTGTYLPLLDRLQRLAAAEVPYRLTLALSPTLLQAFGDPAYQMAYGRFLESHAPADRPELRPETIATAKALWFRQSRGRVARGFAALQRSGHVDLLASTATRACLPLLAPTAGAVRAQIHNGVREYQRIFGTTPSGFWLPHAAYVPGLDDVLIAEGLRYTFVDQRTLPQAEGRPVLSLRCPSGVRIHGLLPAMAAQVSDPENGYSALPVHFGSPRRTRPYDRNRARWIAGEQGREFVEMAQSMIVNFAHLPRAPVVSCVIPAQLLGTAWVEGLEWLESVLRATAGNTVPVSSVLHSQPQDFACPTQQAYPEIGSLEASGGFERWLNPLNDWIYPHLHTAATRLRRVIGAGNVQDGLSRRALSQAGRELLLAQSGDLAEAISGKESSKATSVSDHLGNCHSLLDDIESQTVDGPRLETLEQRHRVLPVLEPNAFLSASELPVQR